MKVSLSWLREITGEALDPVEVAERLAGYGSPVEGVHDFARALADIRVARVLEVRPHPNADTLQLCRVDDGSEEPFQVVCGAPNVRAGALYPFVPVRGVLPDGTRIRKAKLRGEESRGMLCSARELGLGHDHSGILELTGDYPVGASFSEAVGLVDTILDVEVTANRGDLLGHLGVARELSPERRLPPIPGGSPAEFELLSDPRSVTVAGVTLRTEAPELCGRFLGAVIRGVRVGPSPDWLQLRLRSIGARPINNVVDATNWVLFELGQPMHAYDLNRLKGGEVVVRMAGEGETLRTLDEVDRTLDSSMLVIADAERTVDIAGIMGEEESSVSGETSDIFLECAHFAPASIRRTKKALGIQSDAGYRFERYVDPTGQEHALRRCLEILLATAGGTLHPEVADLHSTPFHSPVIELEVKRVEAILGVSFDPEQIAVLLEAIGFRVDLAAGPLRVTVPGWRARDVTRPIDLVEEIARRWGYDRFPELPSAWRPGTVPEHPLFLLEDRVRTLLTGFGFLEAQTPAFAPEGEGEIRLANPLSREEPVLRSSLLPALMRRIEHNLARGNRRVQLFEVGTVFFREAEADPPVREETRVAMIATGSPPPHWAGGARPVDLWDLKGWAEELVALARPGGSALYPAPEPRAPWRPGWRMEIVDPERAPIGECGALAPDRLDLPPWAGEVFALELTLPPEPEAGLELRVIPLPQHPGSERDLALLVPEGVPAARVEAIAREEGGALLQGIAIFDRYEGEGVPQGMAALGWRFRWQAPDRTLTDEEVDAATSRIADRLEEELGVRIRGR